MTSVPITFLFIATSIVSGLGNKDYWKYHKHAGIDSIPNGATPFHVALMIDGKYVCAGSLVSYHHVVTAAHCLDEKLKNPNLDLGAWVSSADWGSNAPIYSMEVNKFVINSRYPQYRDADIAVLKLNNPYMKLQQDFMYAELPRGPPAIGQTVYFLGFGRFTTNRPSASESLKHLPTIIVGCASRMFDGNICTSPSLGTVGCQGDSGGPLVDQDHRLVGIMSCHYGLKDTMIGAQGLTDVYTDVYRYKKFIEGAIAHL